LSPLKAINNIFRAFKRDNLFFNIGGVTEFGQFDHSIKGLDSRLDWVKIIGAGLKIQIPQPWLW